MRRHPSRIPAALAALLVTGGTLIANQASSTFDPAGTWEGPCRSGHKTRGTLHVEFRRDGRVWRAKGGLRSRGYPVSDSNFEEVAVDGPRVTFFDMWGPAVAQFKGEHTAGRLDGTLEAVQDEKVVFRCAWSLTRAGT